MTITPKRLIEGSLITDVIATYYTAPAATQGVIKKLTFCNTHTAALTVTVYLVKAADVPTPPTLPNAKYMLIDARSILSTETYDCYEALLHVLEAGDALMAIASVTNKINVIASGVEVT